MSKGEIAVEVFNNEYNCCQAVLSVFCEELGLNRDIGLKIATGFGGGCREGEVCGAVTGALMAIGLKYGHYIEGDIETKQKAYEITKEFIKAFKEKHNTILCKELLGYDLTKEDDLKQIKEMKLFNTLCPDFVKDAVEVLEDIYAKYDKE